MATEAGGQGTEAGRRARLSAVMREGERVKPLELFFDLVFVLAVTQCTALMVEHPTWGGIGQAMLVLALLWWAWGGYAWLTSVVDPEEGWVRIAMFGAMAALLIAALSVPAAFGDDALAFAVAYGVVRGGHIALFVIASREDSQLRSSVTGLAGGTGVGVGLLVVGALVGGDWQEPIWALALLLDLAEPYIYGAEGWKLVPAHFAERFWLILIVALGESIVALGVGADVGLTLGVIAAAVLGIALVCELWWIYFDVVAIIGMQRLVRAPVGKVRNELARDAYGYLHYLLVAGIVLSALGLHEVLAHVEDPLHAPIAFALLGGIAIYLLGHVTIRFRHVRSINRHRLLLAVLLFALIPAALELPSLAMLAIVTGLLAVMITFETRSYGEERAQLRHST